MARRAFSEPALWCRSCSITWRQDSARRRLSAAILHSSLMTWRQRWPMPRSFRFPELPVNDFAPGALDCADLSALWGGGSLLPWAGWIVGGTGARPARGHTPRGQVRSRRKAQTSLRTPKRCTRKAFAQGCAAGESARVRGEEKHRGKRRGNDGSTSCGRGSRLCGGCSLSGNDCQRRRNRYSIRRGSRSMLRSECSVWCGQRSASREACSI